MPAESINLGQGASMPTPTKPLIDPGSWVRFKPRRPPNVPTWKGEESFRGQQHVREMGPYGAESRAWASKTKTNLVSCPSESEGQETQVGIHPPGRARMGRRTRQRGPGRRDVDGAEGVTAKAGDEADGGEKRGSREKEIANCTTTIGQL